MRPSAPASKRFHVTAFRHISVQAFQRTGIPAHRHPSAPASQRTGIPAHRHPSAPASQRTGIPAHRHPSASAFKRSSANAQDKRRPILDQDNPNTGGTVPSFLPGDRRGKTDTISRAPAF